MTLFTEGRLQAYECMMQDNGRNRRHERPERPERNAGKTFAAGQKPVKKASGKNGERHGHISS